MSKLASVAIGTLVALAAGSASAAPITWSFGGANANLGPDEIFVSGGNALALYGFDYRSVVPTSLAASTPMNAAGLWRTTLGIGVSGYQDGEPSQIDTNGYNELLKIVLPAASASFTFVLSQVDGDDTFALFGLTNAADTSLTALRPTTAIVSSATRILDATGQDNDLWRITVDAPEAFQILWLTSSRDTADGYRLTSFTTQVPEPATLGLLGIGLFGAGWLRRRRG